MSALRPLALWPRLAVCLILLGFSTGIHAQETWTTAPAVGPQNLSGVSYGTGQFVAVGDAGTILTSPDGVAWTRRATGITTALTSVGFANNLFVVVGEAGAILTSGDGIAWTPRNGGTAARLNAISYGNDTWLTAGDTGTALISADGIGWRPAGVNLGQARSLTFAYGQFVATSNQTSAVTFADGLTASTLTATGAILEGVGYGRRRFIAVGEGGRVLLSADAVTWQSTVISGSSRLRGITFFNNTWVAVGDNGVIQTSTDGSTWSSQASGTNSALVAVTASPSAVVAVGAAGKILRSNAVQRPPAVVGAPASLTEVAGNHVLLSVTASGSTPLQFQWTFNGTAIADATSDTLLLPTISAANAGAYSVSITNPLGSVSSPSATLSVAPNASARPPIIDSTFQMTTRPDALPKVVVEQPDGKLLLGGTFTVLNGSVSQSGIARLQRDGALDSTFAPGRGTSPGGVTAIALQADGRIVISGSFTTIANVARPGLARLNSDGAVDLTFSPDPTKVPSGGSVLGIQPDGKIVMIARDSGYRFRPDGSLDSTFSIPFSSWVGDRLAALAPDVFALASDGKILAFTSAWLTRLNSDGSPDPTFTRRSLASDFPVAVNSLAEGGIGTVAAELSSGGRPLSATILNPDGSDNRIFSRLDLSREELRYTTENPRPVFTSTGKLYLSQDTILPVPPRTQRRLLARFNRDGTTDATFSFPDTPGDSADYVVPLQSGKALAVGNFTGADGVRRSGVVRLMEANVAATVPPSIVPNLPEKLTVDEGTSVKIPVGIAGTGPFNVSINGGAEFLLNGNTIELGQSNAQQTTAYWISVTNSFGTVTSPRILLRVLPSAQSVTPPAFFAQPQSLTEALDGNVAFTVSVGGVPYPTLQWLKDGQPISGATDRALFLPAITQAQEANYTCRATNPSGTAVSESARLRVIPSFTPGSAVDKSFEVRTPLDAAPRVVVVQPDGKLLLGGNFLFFYEGSPRVGLARLNPDGSLDPTFNPPNLGVAINTMTLQPDGRIVVGGTLSALPGKAASNVVRLQANGTLDPTFASAVSSVPLQVLVAPSGKLLIVDGSETLSQLNADGSIDASFVKMPVSVEHTAIGTGTGGLVS